MKSYIPDAKAIKFLPIYPLTADSKYLQEYIYRPYGIGFHQIYIVNEGTGYITVNGKKYNLKKFDMFFVKKDVENVYEGYDDNFTLSFLGFDGFACNSLFEYFDVGDFALYKGKNSVLVQSELDDFLFMLEKTKSAATLSAMLYSIISLFFHEGQRTIISPIEKVKNYIELNYQKPLTLDDILKVYPHSKSKLYRDFFNTYQMTLFDMITDTRLKHADFFLKLNPTVTLKELSASCGFNDISYFCKMYKRKYKKSPKHTD